MRDIWKSFIAQRCLWELGYGIIFHAPEVFQDRNQHDLDRDFADEVPGYTRNKEIADVLSRLQLRSGEAQIGDNLRRCYDALVAAGIFPSAELELVELWLENLRLAATSKAAYAKNTCETDSLRGGVENQPVVRRRVIASDQQNANAKHY